LGIKGQESGRKTGKTSRPFPCRGKKKATAEKPLLFAGFR
jgi:hypothetical protein